MLKPRYPYYLANRAVQANACDLAPTYASVQTHRARDGHEPSIKKQLHFPLPLCIVLEGYNCAPEKPSPGRFAFHGGEPSRGGAG